MTVDLRAPGQSKRRAAGASLGLGATALIFLAVAQVTPATESFEGKRNQVYYDPAHIRTACYGETQDLTQRYYSDSQCTAMLQRDLAHEFAPPLLKCVPGFAKQLGPFTWSLDASYNAGAGAFCRSNAARAFRRGQWLAGCNALRRWRVTARVNGHATVLPGLVRRRAFEADHCVKGIA